MKDKDDRKELRIIQGDRESDWLETTEDEYDATFISHKDAEDYEDAEDLEDSKRTDYSRRIGLFHAVDEEAEDTEEDDRELTEPAKDNKKWILMGLLVVFLITLIMFLFSDRFFNMIQGRSSNTLEKLSYEVSFAEGNTAVLLEDNNLLRCSQDGLQALNESGQVVWDVPFSMSAPYMLKAGKYISVADRLGTSLLLIQNGRIVNSISTEETVLLHCVNENGAGAAVLDGGNMHIVNLYSATGEILMQRRTYASTDGIPVAIALSENGSRLATGYIIYTGSRVQTVVTVFDLTESGAELVDRIVGSVVFENSVITDLRFDGDRCFFAGTDRFGMLNTSRGCETIWEQTLSYQMESFVMEDTYFAVRYGDGLAGTATPVTNNIVVYDYNGNVLYEESVSGATYLDAWGDTLICCAGRRCYGLTPKGSPKWQADLTEDFQRLIAFDSGDTVAALRNGQITYYRVTVKNAEEGLND